MAHLYKLAIHHFRGIKDLEVTFGNTKFVAIIGRGDSGKTTILKAIASVLSPNWNLSFNDWDFYQCKTDEPIVIEAVVKDLPDELIKQGKFGLCLGLIKEDGSITYDFEDMPEAELEKCEKMITIRLKVTDNLEPRWTVISGPALDVETEISGFDRAKLKMFQVSDYIDNHFSYSKGSPLYSLLRQDMDDKNTPGEKILAMVRDAYAAIQRNNTFKEFDKVKETIVTLAKGVGLNITELNTLVEFKENAYSESNITLHSNNVPYRLHGKGSKRLLSIAIQKGLVEDGGIVLIDELEQGLEPDRSRNLARLLKQTEKGQVFVTTHSREVIAEVDATSLFMLHEDGGGFETFCKSYQGMLRRIPECVLAKRVICCEGATELGIVRAIDEYLQEKRGFGLAAHGIVYVDCKGGDQFYRDAIRLTKKRIDACVLADDDVENDLERVQKDAAKNNVQGIICDKGKAIEQMLFSYLPWEVIGDMLRHSEEAMGKQNVYPILTYNDAESIEAIKDVAEQFRVREECSKRAGEKRWFKRIDHGEFVGRVWFECIDKIAADSGLKREYDELMDWIENDIN